ncbi:MAG: Asp-tRNA(Asn)/Glu-tRNA(Gln) amidotransferase subunit GatA [Chloroflexi bacterium]|nr:MAG: Asp-tRNA(Asn)/Glu-tRNA(Gln) amidotransferase subunit GatA [Chloroflexota bacterium]
MSDVALLPLQAASELIHSRRASSVELVGACLDRVARHDRELGAFITLTAESALAEAKRADADLANGVDHGPLHGIPVALKDLYDTAGVRTTGGSRIFADRVPERDCAVVEKLRAAGAVFVGKLNLHEWALGVTNQNPHFGPACNPWDTTRIPGGSSGGSAIAVASGFCYVSPGSDTGGSIRIPASLCGVAGLKPTYGRVSLRGVIPLAWTLDHSGPLARTVGDLALALSAIAGHDPLDPSSSETPSDDYAAGIEDGAKDVRVIVPTNHFFDDIDPEVDAAVREAARVLTSLGASVAELMLPRADLISAQRAILLTDAAAYHREHLRERAADIGADVLTRLRTGQTFTGTEYAQARRDQGELRREWLGVLHEHDVILSPTTPIAAPAREGQDAVAAAQRLTANTAPFNLTGLPAISIPCGFTQSGLPIGLQLAAGPWRERLLLRVARAYEHVTPWHERLPLS